MKIHPYNSNKQIHTENTANNNKDNKQHTDPTIIIHDGACVLLPAVDRRVHVIRPPFQSGKHEQGNHGVEDIVEIYVPVQPNSRIVGNAFGLAYVVYGGELGGVAVTRVTR
jgi:hypothetical protein